VVLKRLMPSVVRAPDFLDRVGEVTRAMAISHPNLVRVLDVGEAHESPFLAVEYVEGLTIGELIDKHQEAGRLPAPLAMQVMMQACEGLAAVRAAGLTRGEISRGKIMLARDGTVKVLDLCAANLKQASHPIEPRADVFALGAVLYEMLSSHRPWERPPLDVPPTPLTTWVPDLAPALVAIVERALSRDEAARFADPLALRAALAQLSATVAPVDEPEPKPEPAPIPAPVVVPPPLPQRSSASGLMSRPAAPAPVAAPVDPNAPTAVPSARAALDTLLGRPSSPSGIAVAPVAAPASTSGSARGLPVTSSPSQVGLSTTSASQRGLPPMTSSPSQAGASTTSASQRGLPRMTSSPSQAGASTTSASQGGLPPVTSSPSQAGLSTTSASQRGLPPVTSSPSQAGASMTLPSQRGLPPVGAAPSATSASARGLPPVSFNSSPTLIEQPPTSSSPSQVVRPPPLPPSRPSQIAAAPVVDAPLAEAIPDEPPDPGTSRTNSAQAALRALLGDDAKPQ
jgi:serine/threonine-protein kinase